MNFADRPILVFWETTRACLLACRHCRASAQRERDPSELTTEQGYELIDQISEFGKPAPVLILTGGDCLMRPDLPDLIDYAGGRGLHVAASPSVTPLLNEGRLAQLHKLNVKAVSVSLDGASPATHDAIRGIEDHFEATLDAIRRLHGHGFRLQVNTTVMARNVDELADVVTLLARHSVAIWEVFFLVNVGRGVDTPDLSPAETEDVCHFLVDASRYGILVRTVEAPFFRRVSSWRRDGAAPATAPVPGALYRRLRQRLVAQLGDGVERQNTPTVATRDGAGVVFVAHNGDILPSGFLPLPLGNTARDRLADVYRTHPLLEEIRSSHFHGKCGVCDYREMCAGSRARAYAAFGDPLGDDPACIYQPPAFIQSPTMASA